MKVWIWIFTYYRIPQKIIKFLGRWWKPIGNIRLRNGSLFTKCMTEKNERNHHLCKPLPLNKNFYFKSNKLWNLFTWDAVFQISEVSVNVEKSNLSEFSWITKIFNFHSNEFNFIRKHEKKTEKRQKFTSGVVYPK